MQNKGRKQSKIKGEIALEVDEAASAEIGHVKVGRFYQCHTGAVERIMNANQSAFDVDESENFSFEPL